MFNKPLSYNLEHMVSEVQCSTGLMPEELRGKSLHFPSLTPWINNWAVKKRPDLDDLTPYVNGLLERLVSYYRYT
jgi:hypothetical protein